MLYSIHSREVACFYLSSKILFQKTASWLWTVWRKVVKVKKLFNRLLMRKNRMIYYQNCFSTILMNHGFILSDQAKFLFFPFLAWICWLLLKYWNVHWAPSCNMNFPLERPKQFIIVTYSYEVKHARGWESVCVFDSGHVHWGGCDLPIVGSVVHFLNPPVMCRRVLR